VGLFELALEAAAIWRESLERASISPAEEPTT
jgi:hypothetical protein